MRASLTFLPIVFTLACGDAVDFPTAQFSVRQSIEQLHITHATPGDELAVDNAAGQQLQIGVADALGSLIFRKLPPGSGYVVRTTRADSPQRSGPLTVMSIPGSQPDAAFYRAQTLAPGFGYIRTRDGTPLSIYVTLPGPPDKGPYATVINYSGYDPSKPGAPYGGLEGLCGAFPALCDAPSDPSALIASLLGYATVGVNMRGTGCSGGAYGFFDTLQILDAYDVIEAVAAQPWVLHNKVGMTGISYPGISQLFAAAARPPGLAAITPMSVIGNPFQTLAPGGILNTGFAVTWVQHVVDKAAPYGQGWEQARVDAGDATCRENQLLHGQKEDLIQQIYDNPYYRADLGDPINPVTFVDKIDVPVFLAGAWQDEQTGPFFTVLLDRFTHARPTRITVYNGVHEDAFAPQVMAEWKYFLDFYVARRIPSIDDNLRKFMPLLFNQVFGVALWLPPERFASATSYAEALLAYEAEPPLRVLFEDGGGKTAGAPEATFEQRFNQWPPAETVARTWYLQPGGALSAMRPTDPKGASAFKLDPQAGERTNLASGGNVWDLLPAYDYQPLRAGYAVAFISAPLSEELVMVGTGSVDLWLQSSANDADLQVSLTEVRPDGKEMYVQSGWLRASQRALAKDATPLWPAHTHLAADAAPLPQGAWTPVRVGLASFGHVFRAGSRIRLSIDTPGGTRAAWRFLLKTFSQEVTHRIAHSATYPSSVVLPVLKGLRAGTPLVACPSLRGQPCRAYVPLMNTVAE